MAAIKNLVHLDMAQSEIQNAVIQVLGIAPGTPVEGQIYYDSTASKKQLYFHNGTGFQAILPNGDKGDITVSSTTVEGDTWTIDANAVTFSKIQQIATDSFLGRITAGTGNVEVLTMAQATSMLDLFSTSTTAQGLVPGSNGGSTLFLRGDGTWATPAGGFTGFDVGDGVGFQSVNDGDLLDITGSGGIDTSVSKVSTTITLDVSLSDMAAYTVKGNNTSGTAAPSDIALTTNAVLGRLAAGIVNIAIIDDDTMTTATASNIATAESIKAYVDSSVAGGLVYKGGYNASTNTPDLDTAPSGVLIGDTYTVTAAGTFFTEDVQVGDMLIAEVNSASTLADWTIVNKNIPDIVSASETAEGLIEIATQAEVDAGTDDARAVTPLKLSTFLGLDDTNLTTTVTYTQLIGNGALTTIPVTHNIGRQHVQATVHDATTGDVLIAEVENTSTTVTTFKFNTAPTTDQYRVVIQG